MSASPVAYLEKALLTSPGVPLRVAVYTRISQGIRMGVFPLASALPRETELATALHVSRTVVREALMLLEEDGLIRTRRGVGRFVVESMARPGLERLRPLETALCPPGSVVRVRTIEVSQQETTDFVSDRLVLAADGRMWFREATIEQDGTPIALVQEYLPAGDETDLGRAIADAVRGSAAADATILRILIDNGLIFNGGTCEFATNVAGPTRASHLRLTAATPVLLLTQTAQLGERTVYLAKCAVAPAVGHLVVSQATGA